MSVSLEMDSRMIIDAKCGKWTWTCTKAGSMDMDMVMDVEMNI
jgi:hypothetical protein